jgi:hypothetical protein
MECMIIDACEKLVLVIALVYNGISTNDILAYMFDMPFAVCNITYSCFPPPREIGSDSKRE